MNERYITAEKKSAVRACRTPDISENIAQLTSSELERIRSLAYLIERDGSSTVHVRGYAAEIDQAAHLLSSAIFCEKKE